MYDDFLNFMNYPYTVSTKNNYRSTNRAIPATQVPTDIIELIKDVVNAEKDNEAFYNFLIVTAPTEEDKQILEEIRTDERKHNELFRRLYLELTGLSLGKSQIPTESELNLTYIKGLEEALKSEIKSSDDYRRILVALNDRQKQNMVMEALIDDLRHSALYNYLITKNMVRPTNV